MINAGNLSISLSLHLIDLTNKRFNTHFSNYYSSC